jgi:hypothetical protein
VRASGVITGRLIVARLNSGRNTAYRLFGSRISGPSRGEEKGNVLAAVVKLTVMAGENLTVGSTIWLPAESIAPGR